MRVFFDTEFTGLHQNTTLISIGCVSDDGDAFYAELADYDRDQVDEWIQTNVIDQLTLMERMVAATDTYMSVSGKKATVQHYLEKWLLEQSTKHAVYGDARNWLPDAHPQPIVMYSDCLAYDWVLFCELFGGALSIPKCVYYIPIDLATALLARNHDPDVSREEFAGMTGGVAKHNALWDAEVIRACFHRLDAE